jgi:hypothetical protein
MAGMKAPALVFAAVVGLSGCAVVPAEPVVYAAPPPPPVVVVRPAPVYGYYGHYYYRGGPYWRHGWR